MMFVGYGFICRQKRDVLSRTKQVRDALRIENHKMRENGGLVCNKPLLRDFEDRADEAEALRAKLGKLKVAHAELTLNLTGVRRKVDEVQGGRL